MKKICVLFCVIFTIMSIAGTSALAAEPEENVIDLGGGYYVVETTTQYSVSRSGDMIGGSKTGSLYHNSKLIGTATLAAFFDISGPTAKATDAWIEDYTENGGTYDSESARVSGNKAYGTVTFKYNGLRKSLQVTLTCSPDGTLS